MIQSQVSPFVKPQIPFPDLHSCPLLCTFSPRVFLNMTFLLEEFSDPITLVSFQRKPWISQTLHYKHASVEKSTNKSKLLKVPVDKQAHTINLKEQMTIWDSLQVAWEALENACTPGQMKFGSSLLRDCLFIIPPWEAALFATHALGSKRRTQAKFL